MWGRPEKAQRLEIAGVSVHTQRAANPANDQQYPDSIDGSRINSTTSGRENLHNFTHEQGRKDL